MKATSLTLAFLSQWAELESLHRSAARLQSLATYGALPCWGFNSSAGPELSCLFLADGYGLSLVMVGGFLCTLGYPFA
jgi:hypothetical protein